MESGGRHLEFLKMLRERKDLAITKPCEVSVAVFLQHRTTNASAADCYAAGGLALEKYLMNNISENLLKTAAMHERRMARTSNIDWP